MSEAVTSYISFCEDSCVPSSTRVCYNNDKPWFTAKLKKLRLEKEEAFRSGDRVRFRESKYRFGKEVREAKRLYSEKLQHQFSANDSASVWKGLRLITSCKPRAPHSTNDPRLANDLNKFYCRFDGQWDSPDTIPRDTNLLPINCTSPTTAKACAFPQLPTSEPPPSSPSTVTTLSSLPQDLHHHPCPQKNKDHRAQRLQTRRPDLCGDEGIWAPCASPPQSHHWPSPGPPAVCLQSQQVCRQCS